MPKSLRAFLICAAPLLIVGCNNERQDAARSSHHTTTATTVSTNTQAPPNVDIFTASGAGNLKAIAQHIAAGTNLDVKEPAGGGTPLFVTTVAGQTEAARLLIDSGASLGATNNDGATALHTAAFFGHSGTVKLLHAHRPYPISSKSELSAMSCLASSNDCSMGSPVYRITSGLPFSAKTNSASSVVKARCWSRSVSGPVL